MDNQDADELRKQENHRKATRRCPDCEGYGTTLGAGPDRGNPTCTRCGGTGRIKRDYKKERKTAVEGPEPVGERQAAPEPLYAKCPQCAANPDMPCAFCSDGYIATGYDTERLDKEVDRGDVLLILIADVVKDWVEKGISVAGLVKLTDALKGRQGEVELARSRQ